MQPQINIAGLGAGDLDQLPLGVYKRLKDEDNKVYIRTTEHPVVQQLQQENLSFQSFDAIYELHDTFAGVYDAIVAELLQASKQAPVVYAVPGHPMMAEKTVQLLLDNPDVTVNIIGGQSFLDDLFTTLGIDPIDGFQLLDATDFKREALKLDQPLVIAQVYDRMMASHIKLTLLEDLPADYAVTIVKGAGTNQAETHTKPLSELDHTDVFNNLTSVYVPAAPPHLLNHTFSRLRDVIARLRSPGGCPWDRAQTHESLRAYAIEEVYELIEAIDQSDDEGIIEELGDVLLQVMLHSQIGQDDGYFSVDDVINTLTDKMIHRHPHVFADIQADTVDDVHQNWDQLKQQEKGSQRQSLLDGIPQGLPALVHSLKLQKKAAKAGFDSDDAAQIWTKVDEERAEVEGAIASQSFEDLEKEIGELIFALVNLARYYNVRPELALNRSNQTFSSRFRYIESRVFEQNKALDDVTLEEIRRYWNEAKSFKKE